MYYLSYLLTTFSLIESRHIIKLNIRLSEYFTKNNSYAFIRRHYTRNANISITLLV